MAKKEEVYLLVEFVAGVDGFTAIRTLVEELYADNDEKAIQQVEEIVRKNYLVRSIDIYKGVLLKEVDGRKYRSGK